MKFITSDEKLVIDFVGVEQVWAFKGKLSVPVDTIESVNFVKEFKDWRGIELRAPGTFVPGALVAGSYFTAKGWDFVYITNPHGWIRPKASDVLLISTAQNRYKRIILSCTPKQADEIIAWWREARKRLAQKPVS